MKLLSTLGEIVRGSLAAFWNGSVTGSLAYFLTPLLTGTGSSVVN